MGVLNLERTFRWQAFAALVALVLFSQTLLGPAASTAQDWPTKSSYDQMPRAPRQGDFQAVMAKDKADKAGVMARQKKLLEERYDLTSRPDKNVTMSRGKPIQDGVRVKLPAGMTWDEAGRR